MGNGGRAWSVAAALAVLAACGRSGDDSPGNGGAGGIAPTRLDVTIFVAPTCEVTTEPPSVTVRTDLFTLAWHNSASSAFAAKINYTYMWNGAAQPSDYPYIPGGWLAPGQNFDSPGACDDITAQESPPWFVIVGASPCSSPYELPITAACSG